MKSISLSDSSLNPFMTFSQSHLRHVPHSRIAMSSWLLRQYRVLILLKLGIVIFQPEKKDQNVSDIHNCFSIKVLTFASLLKLGRRKGREGGR